jgi:signal transduction histidine kinase
MGKFTISPLLRRVFVPPTFPDEVKSRQAELVNAILWVGALLAFAFTLLNLVYSAAPARFLLLNLATLFLHFFGLYLLRRGAVRLVTFSYCLALWVLAFSATVAFGQLRLSDAGTLLTVTLIAGALLGPKMGFLFAGISASGVFLATWLQAQGVLSLQTYATRPVFVAATLAVNLILVAVVVSLADRSLAYSRDRADQQQSMLLERSRQLEAAADIGMAAAYSRDLGSLLENITSAIAERFSLYHVSIFALEHDKQDLILQPISSGGTATYHNKQLKLSMQEKSILLEVAKTKRPYRAIDVSADPLYLENPDLPEARSELALPIFAAGELFGVIDLLSDQMIPFGQDDLNVMQVLANQVGTAIHNARLIESTQRHLEELITLHSVATASIESQTEDELITRVTRTVGETLYPRNFGVLLVDLEHKQLIHHASYTESRGNLAAPPIPLGEGITGLVALSGLPMRVADATKEAKYISVDPNARSELCVPIKVGSRVLGVINIESEKVDAFTPADEHLLQTLAGQFAISLERIRLLREANQRTEELVQALDRQEELNRLQNDFVRNVSHEFRTPLSLVSGYVQLLESGEMGELSAEHQQAISVVARRTEMLNKMVEDLTAILEIHSRDLNPTVIRLADFLRSIQPAVSAQATAANLNFELEIKAEGALILGEAAYLDKVIDNLAANAIKFTPSPGMVTLRLKSDEEFAIIEIQDTGIGIPKEEQGRIFERFYQVDSSSTRRYGGTGLGLALASEIIDLHQGRIEIKSGKGKGSTFRVFLPLHPRRGINGADR